MPNLSGTTSYILPHRIGRKMEHVCVTSLGMDTGKHATGLTTWTSPLVPLPFADLNLHYFTVIKHNHNYNCCYEFCASLSLLVILGTPKTTEFAYPLIIFLYNC